MIAFSPEKLGNLIIFFKQNTSPQKFGLTKFLKLLYFLDKEHLNQYLRPVLGDFYVKMERGPVASSTYDLIKDIYLSIEQSKSQGGRSNLENFSEMPKQAAVLSAYVDVYLDKSNKYRSYSFLEKKTFDKSLFSKSEITLMTEIASKYYEFTAKELSELTHKEEAWLSGTMNQPIPLESLLVTAELREQFLENERESAALAKLG